VLAEQFAARYMQRKNAALIEATVQSESAPQGQMTWSMSASEIPALGFHLHSWIVSSDFEFPSRRRANEDGVWAIH